MFTGIIQALGQVQAIEKKTGGLRLQIDSSGFFADAQPGDSIAVDGTCLTIESKTNDKAQFFLSEESLEKTHFKSAAESQWVNLEKSLQAHSFLGGHFVQGHVDGLGEILSLENAGEVHTLEVKFPSEMARYFVPKGSVCINGVSLTINELRESSLSICLIPETWKKTNFRYVKENQKVNLEVDVLAKYIERHLSFLKEKKL